MNAPPDALLTLDAVSRSFGGVHAADAVSFQVKAGTVHGLIGPNGAGKTTLLNLISGILPVETGIIHLQQRRIDTLPSYRIAALGIRRTYQNIRLFGAMSARDNVIVGLHTLRRDAFWRRLYFSPSARRSDRLLQAAAIALLGRVGLAHRAVDRARDLSYGEQRRLEIARALASEPVLLLLDEPTAGMDAAETSEIRSLLGTVTARGTAVLLVEHNVELVMSVADEITVLDFGRVIASGPPEQVRHDPAVIAAYLGTQE